jgi:periplasmic divalent cation tolerance protein
MTGLCLIQTSCSSEEMATAIAETVVDRALAACATIIPTARTYYAAHGTALWDDAFLVLITTSEPQFQAIAEVIKRIHSYEVPEVLMVRIDRGSEDFKAWVREGSGDPGRPG